MWSGKWSGTDTCRWRCGAGGKCDACKQRLKERQAGAEERRINREEQAREREAERNAYLARGEPVPEHLKERTKPAGFCKEMSTMAPLAAQIVSYDPDRQWFMCCTARNKHQQFGLVMSLLPDALLPQAAWMVWRNEAELLEGAPIATDEVWKERIDLLDKGDALKIEYNRHKVCAESAALYKQLQKQVEAHLKQTEKARGDELRKKVGEGKVERKGEREGEREVERFAGASADARRQLEAEERDQNQPVTTLSPSLQDPRIAANEEHREKDRKARYTSLQQAAEAAASSAKKKHPDEAYYIETSKERWVYHQMRLHFPQHFQRTPQELEHDRTQVVQCEKWLRMSQQPDLGMNQQPDMPPIPSRSQDTQSAQKPKATQATQSDQKHAAKKAARSKKAASETANYPWDSTLEPESSSGEEEEASSSGKEVEASSSGEEVEASSSGEDNEDAMQRASQQTGAKPRRGKKQGSSKKPKKEQPNRQRGGAAVPAGKRQRKRKGAGGEAEEPAEQPAEEPAEQPAEEPAKQPVEGPADRPRRQKRQAVLYNPSQGL